MNKSSLLILFLLSSVFFSSAQNKGLEKEIDSLHKAANNAYYDNDIEKSIALSSLLIDKGEEYNILYPKFYGYDMLGGIYRTLEDTLKAIEYSEKALNIAVSTKNDSLIAWGSLNLGEVLTTNKKTYKKGISLLEQSVPYYKKNKFYEDLHLVYTNLAWAYLDYDEFDKAMKFVDKARSVEAKHEIGVEFVTYTDFLKAKYNFFKRNYALAEKQFTAISKVVDKEPFSDLGEDTYNFLKKIALEKKDYKNAFLFLEKEKAYAERIFHSNKLQAVEVAGAQFKLKEISTHLDIALKEQEYSKQLAIKSSETTNTYKVASLLLFLALLGFLFLFKERRKLTNNLKLRNEELVLANKKAEQLSKAKSQFFSTVSHELRTPLYGVIGLSSMLQEDITLKKHAKDLASLKFSADYLLALINDVLLLNKMDYQDLVLENVPFKLNTLVKNITKSFEFSLEQNNNKLYIDIDKNIPNNLIGSSVRISQILMNLIGNATKFNENGNIWLTLDYQGLTNLKQHKVKFIIKDDGIGIPEEQQGLIFDNFSQVKDDNYNYKGTGLGLSIVKKLIELHGSKIYLESTLGEGTEFSFTLDLAENLDAKNKAQTTETFLESKIEKDKNVHVLVVDDNLINQKVTQRMLLQNDITSDLASDGEEAILMAKANTYNLILMDINMPKKNGFEATKAIRTFNKEIPIIALTALEIEEMQGKILKIGMNDILSKPYDNAQFTATILKNLNL